VNKTVRAMCIFARQNLTVDPPFSNLDLVSCRNVLIYLGQSLQRKVFPIFHYALRPDGLLMLGASESIGAFSDLFSLMDKKAKIYSKKEMRTHPAVSFGHRMPATISTDGEHATPVAPIAPEIPNVQKQADRIVLTTFSPAGVVINRHMEVLQFRGRTSAFLEHPHGNANLDLLKMAREDLVLDLRSIITKAIKQNASVRQEHIRVRQNGHSFECSIEVVPFTAPPSQEKFYLVLFERKNISIADEKIEKKSRGKLSPTAEGAQVVRLRRELAAMRESLQDIIGEQEATNEELRAANEEIMSSNEELQSTNEELETAKEELQSTNEELTTLNDELESRNTELEQVNNDLHNLLASVSIPVIILGPDLRIRRFTSAAEKLFKLIPGDVGRPITDISAPLDIPDFEKQVLEVLETLVPKDLELQDRQGHWWSARIRAYRTTDHKIDGAVIALVDIDLLKAGMEKIELARNFAEAIVHTVREPMLVLDNELIVKSANPAFYRTFQVGAQKTIDRRIYELGDRHFDIPRLRTLLEEILQRNNSFNDFEVEHYFPDIGKKKLLLNARRLVFDGLENQMILLAIEDVSEKSNQ
ncbi:MAG TPA: PAS domain-containing protein, partial [Methylomirabilota bacterium]|nr:PAS domain-containing protein [Methylomirabilota bacterium]